MGEHRRRVLTGLGLTVAAAAAVGSLVAGIVLLPTLATLASSAPAQADGFHKLPRNTAAPVTSAHQAGVWPLPGQCYLPLADGREPTAADHKVLHEIDGVVLVDLRVRSGQLLGSAPGVAGSCATKLWNVVRALYPTQELGLIDHLVIFEGAPTEQVTGEVSPDDAGTTRWTLSLSMLGEDDLAFTLTHELGHLLSLNPAEVDPADEPADGCDTYPTGEGCSRPGSILDNYTRNAWNQDLLAKWFDIDAISDDAKRDAALRELYSDHAAEFYDAYAATDPDEDFAETFAAWCLDAPLRTPTLVRKASFMEHRHELTGMKARCSSVLG